jgi:Fe2+ transport system protein FeoA
MEEERVSEDMAMGEEKRVFLTNNYGTTMAVEGGHGIRQKLFLRGLFEGSVVRMISCYGPVTIEVDRNMVSIGRGMAQKVIVRRM